MNLNLNQKMLSVHPYVMMDGLEQWAVFWSMLRSCPVGTYAHNPKLFEAMSGVSDAVFKVAMEKMGNFVLADGDTYWFRDHLLTNCGGGSKLLDNKMLTEIAKRMASTVFNDRIREMIYQQYPEIESICEECRVNGRVSETVKAMQEARRCEANAKKKKPKPSDK